MEDIQMKPQIEGHAQISGIAQASHFWRRYNGLLRQMFIVACKFPRCPSGDWHWEWSLSKRHHGIPVFFRKCDLDHVNCNNGQLYFFSPGDCISMFLLWRWSISSQARPQVFITWADWARAIFLPDWSNISLRVWPYGDPYGQSFFSLSMFPLTPAEDKWH